MAWFGYPFFNDSMIGSAGHVLPWMRDTLLFGRPTTTYAHLFLFGRQYSITDCTVVVQCSTVSRAVQPHPYVCFLLGSQIMSSMRQHGIIEELHVVLDDVKQAVSFP